MNYLKLFESFVTGIQKLTDENWREELKDVFIPVCDHGLYIKEIYEGNFLSMGVKSIIQDHNKLTHPTVSGFGIRLRPNHKWDIKIDKDFLEDLKYSILHTESLLNVNLHLIYFCTPSGNWFKSIDSLIKSEEKYPTFMNTLSNHTVFIDVIFKV